MPPSQSDRTALVNKVFDYQNFSERLLRVIQSGVTVNGTSVDHAVAVIREQTDIIWRTNELCMKIREELDYSMWEYRDSSLRGLVRIEIRNNDRFQTAEHVALTIPGDPVEGLLYRLSTRRQRSESDIFNRGGRNWWGAGGRDSHDVRMDEGPASSSQSATQRTGPL
jgi:hypothetical protein